jgi:hypothetical protein
MVVMINIDVDMIDSMVQISLVSVRSETFILASGIRQ